MELLFLEEMSKDRLRFYDLDEYYPVPIQRIENDGWSSFHGISDFNGLRKWLKEHMKEEVIVDTGWITILHFYDEGDAVMFKMSKWAGALAELDRFKR